MVAIDKGLYDMGVFVLKLSESDGIKDIDVLRWDTNPKNKKYAGWYFHTDIVGIKINSRYKGDSIVKKFCVKCIVWHEYCHHYTNMRYGFTGHGKEFIVKYCSKPGLVVGAFIVPFIV